MIVNIEEAGFQIRDMIAWVYGSGFPKSLDVSKAIDKIDAVEERRARALEFTAWLRSTGLSASDINRLTGTNMGGHYTAAASQPAVATADLFDLVRTHLPEVPERIEDLVRQRTVESENMKARKVVGQKPSSLGGTVAAKEHDPEIIAHHKNLIVDITEPHTPQAVTWQGWGTALKPAFEPIVVARKPLIGTVAANVLAHGAGALNINGCRLGGEADRWPANLIHDGSEEVTGLFGTASRFFYCAKANKSDREEGNNHPTVKPTTLMRYLCRLITPPKGTILDPFMGSGSTGKAAKMEGFSFVGVEREKEYCEIAKKRIESAARYID